MAKFEVGEIVIGQNFMKHIHRNGMECEITGGLKKRTGVITDTNTLNTERMYKIKWANGDITLQPSSNLRKKKPPQETSTWEQIQIITKWNPTKTRVKKCYHY